MNKTTKQMTVTEYAKHRGITAQAVYQNIKRGYALPGVTEVEPWGKRGHILTVEVPDPVTSEDDACI